MSGRRSRQRNQDGSTPKKEQSTKEICEEQAQTVAELKVANEELKAALREKFPDEEDQKYLGIWVEKTHKDPSQ